ncbi:hypothetical protein [Aquimarina brevivitae]|uniref:Glycine dehydrogenase n=1 Tax=Aquimarina brevivitae TaxID=323412 RepID=A0A4Q7PLN8_9FLAO|nr:hypothetical protein [Aquimarina brevivitae]RZS99912.1 hypothetical protein EV197_1143 [Aquimarina brevivitae]
MSEQKNNIIVKCGEANHFCDKNQYREASLWEKVKLNIHLLYCKACRKYSSKNNRLSKLISNSEVHTMDPGTKKALQQRVQEKLAEKD